MRALENWAQQDILWRETTASEISYELFGIIVFCLIVALVICIKISKKHRLYEIPDEHSDANVPEKKKWLNLGISKADIKLD